MKVHGYDENKHVVSVDLTVEEIVAEDIDPWRLDLFDPDPVTLFMPDGQLLNFRKLEDLYFAYNHEGRRIVCLRDESGDTCLSERWRESTGLRLDHEPFQVHLSRFLEECGKDKHGLCHPFPASVARLAGNRVKTVSDPSLMWDLAQKAPVFVGEMNEYLDLPIDLPEAINWILRVLAPFNPYVSGSAVAQAIANKPVKNVMVKLPDGLQPEVTDVLKGHGIKLSWEACVAGLSDTFKHEGCQYLVFYGNSPEGLPISRLLTDDGFHFPSTKLRCYLPNQVRGTRMQFFEHARSIILRDKFAEHLRAEVDKYVVADRKKKKADVRRNTWLYVCIAHQNAGKHRQIVFDHRQRLQRRAQAR